VSQHLSTTTSVSRFAKRRRSASFTIDVAPLITMAGDVLDGTRKLETKLMGHGAREKSATMEDSVRGRCEGITRSAATGLDDALS
jgi:hypothetical protein